MKLAHLLYEAEAAAQRENQPDIAKELGKLQRDLQRQYRKEREREARERLTNELNGMRRSAKLREREARERLTNELNGMRRSAKLRCVR